jgi:hypothetical protein
MIQVVGAAVPFLEIGMAVALLFPKTRRIGVIAIVVMHIFLLAVLGPWALSLERRCHAMERGDDRFSPLSFSGNPKLLKGPIRVERRNWAYRAILCLSLFCPR